MLCQHLHSLTLWCIPQTIPASWSNLQALTKLCLQSMEIGPQNGLYRLPSLQHLELQDCRAMTQEGPEGLVGVELRIV
jgi:hypothetical protein